MVERHAIPDCELREYVDATPRDGHPRIAVIVPVYDEPRAIRRTVESVTGTTYERYELHVVCTPADGETQDSLAELSEHHEKLTVHTETEHRTPGSARNVAIDRTDADVSLFVDADMTIEGDTLWKLAFLFTEGSVDYLGLATRMESVDEGETLAGWYDEHVRFPVRYFMNELRFCPSCCLAVRDRVFRDGLRFNPTLVSAEDVVFGHEVFNYGYEVGFSPDVSVTHPVRTSVSEILSKGKKTGVGNHQVFTQYPVPHIYERSPLRSVDSYLPKSRYFLRNACRGWSSMSLKQRIVVHLFAYLEKLATTGQFAREALRGDSEDLPDQVERMHETVQERRSTDAGPG